jgi:3-phosphoshikimate 1-carboxyvinyltransferase
MQYQDRSASSHVPVITIDGPTASGKGTLASLVAARLGWHYLDSGALYRLVALSALETAADLADEAALARLAAALPVVFQDGRLWLAGRDVTELVRQEHVGNAASRLSVHRAVRAALVELQHGFRRLPGLVADGRDMGTVIFPDARLKVFLTASARTRAERRCKQLIDKGFSAKLEDLLRDLEERDKRDASRVNAPTRPAEDALLLDNSDLTVDETVNWVIEQWQTRSAA